MHVTYCHEEDSSFYCQATFIGYPEPSVRLILDVVLNPGELSESDMSRVTDLISAHPGKRQYLDIKGLHRLFGVGSKDITSLRNYLREYGITLKDLNKWSRTAEFSGCVDELEKALDTRFGLFESRGRELVVANLQPFHLPDDVSPIIHSFRGSYDQLKREFRRPTPRPRAADDLVASGGYTPEELAKAYGFPPKTSGKGQCIGVIELGGEYKESDFKQFFKENGIKEPKIDIVGDPTGQSSNLNNAEVTLDLEIMGALCPDAHIVVYYATSVLEAMRMIISDTAHRPDVVSISWAGSESNYTSQEIQQMNQVFYEAALSGMTVLGASGDHGGYNGKRQPNVSLPSSNPWVLGCGGTIIDLNGDVVESEVVWNENQGTVGTGGGFSSLYVAPGYQYQAIGHYPYQKYSTRGVPDMAADASTKHGYKVVFEGQNTVIGGTSAATPLLAALIARMNEALGYNLGFVNGLLYECAGTDAFRPITQGNNQVYYAAPYWNPCTGLGSPHGVNLLNYISSLHKTK